MFSVLISSKNTFDGQLPGEETVLVKRRHWFVIIIPVIFVLFLFILPFVVYFFIKNFLWYDALSSLYWFLSSVYFLILWIYLFYLLVIYVLTVTIVTNQRLIKCSQLGFFNYRRDETELKKIQDISVKISGPVQTFLHFGNLEVQTAGTEVKFSFEDLPEPQEIKEIIYKQIHPGQ